MQKDVSGVKMWSAEGSCNFVMDSDGYSSRGDISDLIGLSIFRGQLSRNIAYQHPVSQIPNGLSTSGFAISQ
jgi:hypothetical protein